mgnify:CR=1 FL=1
MKTFHGMEKAARIQAQERANRDQVPMHVYRFDHVAAIPGGWEATWYVRAANEERPMFARFIVSIMPERVQK